MDDCVRFTEISGELDGVACTGDAMRDPLNHLRVIFAWTTTSVLSVYGTTSKAVKFVKGHYD